MSRIFNKLMREQIQERIDIFTVLRTYPKPKIGWIRTIRQALGMSSYVLAQKLGCSRANITQIEKREIKGTLSIELLEQVAHALSCRLVYALVPDKKLDTLREEQAQNIARKRIRVVNQSMKLEQQGLSAKQLKRQENNLVSELLAGSSKNLWKRDAS